MRRSFTLIELLVVVAIIAVLISILLPAMATARGQARSAVCRSNVRQLFIANLTYATENADHYVRAAPDIFTGFGGRLRWHGVRETDSPSANPAMNAFDPMKGPLKDSLLDGKAKQCPETVSFVKEGKQAFEASCGGYGYNTVGIGSRAYKLGYGPEAMASSMRIEEIANASNTVMFTDTAFVQGYPETFLVEYSFCEPPKQVYMDGNSQIVEMWMPIPSIHFRHLADTCVVWTDGHASREPFAFTMPNAPSLDHYRIGWFGQFDTNELFDCN